MIVVAPVADLEEEVFDGTDVMINNITKQVENGNFGENWNTIELALYRKTI